MYSEREKRGPGIPGVGPGLGNSHAHSPLQSACEKHTLSPDVHTFPHSRSCSTKGFPGKAGWGPGRSVQEEMENQQLAAEPGSTRKNIIESWATLTENSTTIQQGPTLH